MSRTTTALKRLGVPAVAAITIIAGVPAFVATSANAATGDTVTMTPDADSASVGTCNPFTVTAKNSTGGPATATVSVLLEERTAAGAAGIETFDVTFCSAATDTTNGVRPSAPIAGSEEPRPSPAGNDQLYAEFATDSTGTFTFGIMGDEPGVVDVTAFIDDGQGTEANRGNNRLDANEIRDASVKTFTASGDDAVRSVTASPRTDTNFVGEEHVVLATLRNASGDTVRGVQPAADVTSGPNNAQTINCDASDNEGVSRCRYTGTATGTDTIVVFVNQSNPGGTTPPNGNASLQPGEPSDTVTKTYQTAPENLQITIACGDADTPRSSAKDCINPLSDNTEVFTATVTAPDGTDAGTERDLASGVQVRFAVTGDTNTTVGDADPTLDPQEATTDASGRATVTLTDPAPKEGEVITVTATVRGQTSPGPASDSATKTFRTAQAGEERFISLTPESATTEAGTFRTFEARVTSVTGEVVPGVVVTFNETGAGAFRTGGSQVQATTDAQGIARADVTSGATEFGTQTITASLPRTGSVDNCERAAGDPSGASAGDCSDSSTNEFVAATSSPSPSATPTGDPNPPAVPCTVAASVTLERDTIIATGSAGVTVRATPNSVVRLFAYTRPSTTYREVRNAELGANGTATFRVVPPANTRLYAKQDGCDAGTSVVLNVRTALSLNVVRNGKQDYTFSGDSLPARPGGLIVSLYRVTNDGRQVLTSQARASATTGDWTIRRVFTGTGRFGFVVRTGQDLQNAPGSSNIRSLLIF